MEATKEDILDLVKMTVIDLHGPGLPNCPDVRLDGANILIGDKPVSIADIRTQKYSCAGFIKLIRGAM